MRVEVRLFLLFGVVGVVLAQLISVSSRRAVHSALIADIQRPLRAQAPELGASMRLGLSPGFERHLPEYLRGCLSGLRASYAAAIGPDGRALAVEGEGFSPEARDSFLRLALRSKGPSSREVGEGAGTILEFFVPVEAAGQARGGLLLGLPLGESLAAEDEIANQVFWHTGSLSGAALLFLLAYTRRLIGPLRALARGVERVARGEYGATVDVEGHREARELAERFNEMSRELSRTVIRKAYLDGILTGMEEGLFVADGAGTVRLANPAMARLAGLAPAECVGRPLSVLLDQAGLDAWREALDGARARNREAHVLGPSRRVPILLSLSRLGADGVIGAVRDVTELKGKDLRLRQAEKLSSIGKLAAGIAHEINNPLGSILGFAQASLDRVQGADPIRPALAGIEEEARRCRTLVRDLLDFSRRTAPETVEFDLGEVVLSSMKMVESQARVQGVRVRPDIAGGVRVRADRGQLQQVVLNLVENALDAMPSGGTLTVRVARAGAQAVLEVEDTGSGVPEPLKERIFEPFFTTKGAGQGTGLGLAVVQGIVADHGGAVEAGSAPGGGGRLTVRLPPAPLKSA